MSAANDNFRSSDIEFLFECLGYAANPLVINVAAMGTAKDAKPNTLQKRLTSIAKRYNLNISSTTKGDTAGPVTPAKAKATNTKAKTLGTGTGGKKRKAAVKVEKIQEESEEDEDDQEESESRSKKQKADNDHDGVDMDANGEANGEEADGDADELA